MMYFHRMLFARNGLITEAGVSLVGCPEVELKLKMLERVRSDAAESGVGCLRTTRSTFTTQAFWALRAIPPQI